MTIDEYGKGVREDQDEKLETWENNINEEKRNCWCFVMTTT